MKLPTCREAAWILFDAARELSPEERQALDAHLAECLACERVAQQANWLRTADRAWSRHREPGSDGPG